MQLEEKEDEKGYLNLRKSAEVCCAVKVYYFAIGFRGEWRIVNSVARRGNLSESSFGRSNKLRRTWKGVCVDERRVWFRSWDGLTFLFKEFGVGKK